MTPSGGVDFKTFIFPGVLAMTVLFTALFSAISIVGVIGRPLLYRAWIFLGLLEAVPVLGGFFFVLLRAGWNTGDQVSSGHPLITRTCRRRR
jgi:hypothetical protein